jgi:capsular exopolysaccharide synthesis family protein
MEDQFQNQADSGLTIKDLLFKYLRFLPLFIISIALALLVAYIYLRYTTPVYASSGALIVKDDNGTSANSGDRFQQLFVLDNSMNLKNEIEIIRSRPLLKRVVENLNLNLTYYVVGKIKESNIYTACPFRVQALQIADSNISFTLHIKIENNKSFRLNDDPKLLSFGQTFENNNGIFKIIYNPVNSLSNEYKVVWSPTESIVSVIAKNLTVAPGTSAGIIHIGLESDNPQLAADFITDLMKEYQVATREDKNETNRRMLDFIDTRMKGVEKELDSVTFRLLAYQRENNMINPEMQSGNYFSKLISTDEGITAQLEKDNTADMLDSYLRNEQNAYTLVPSTLGLDDGTLSVMVSAYNVAQLERKSLIDANIPESNLRVKQKEDEIERLRINILESIKNQRRFISTTISNLQRQNSKAQAQVKSLPIKEQNLLEIKTKQQTKQTVYNLLLEKREQTAISLAGTISNMKVIEEAHPNPLPIKPKPSTVYLISLVAGLALPALFVFGIEIFNDKVNSRHDIEKATSVAIVGEVGHSYLDDKMVVKPNNRSIVAEQFRIIRSNLQYVMTNTKKPVILVTSSFSGEGKSFISTNLGAVMALANKKTIILEFDIRKPKVLSHLGIPKKPGITNYLLGTVTLEQLPIPVPGYENLYVLACGPIPPNPSELLLEPKIAEIFAYLKENFDVIIVDSAPVGMVSDAMTLSAFADSTLYITRQGHTYKKQITLLDEFHTQRKLPKMSIILNDVKLTTGYGYYGYGRYGYGYGYSAKSGYFTDDAPKNGRLRRWFGWMDMKKWDKKTKV